METILRIPFPKSEQTVKRHNYKLGDLSLKNDMGYACTYRIVQQDGKELGTVQYYRGRLLAVHSKIN